VPSESLFKVARAMFKDLWSHQLKSGEQEAERLKTELSRIEKQVSQVLDRITATDVPSVVSAYENRIRELEDEKIITTEAISNRGRPCRAFNETLGTALDFLANPWKLWQCERLDDKKPCLNRRSQNAWPTSEKRDLEPPFFRCHSRL
jgi:site-specific DNA recombinase